MLIDPVLGYLTTVEMASDAWRADQRPMFVKRSRAKTAKRVSGDTRAKVKAARNQRRANEHKNAKGR